MIITPKNNVTIFSLAILLIQILFLAFLLLTPKISQAITFKPQVPIGDFRSMEIDAYSIGEYIREIYKYAIGIVGIVAAAVIMWSGFSWIMAGGNPQKITEARSWLTGSLGGLVLAMTSFLVLNTINPALIDIKKIDPITIGKYDNCCSTTKGSFQGFLETKNGKQSYSCSGTPEQEKPYGAIEPFNPKIKKCIKDGDTWKPLIFGCCLSGKSFLSSTGITEKEYDDCDNETKKKCTSMYSSNEFHADKSCQNIGGALDDKWICI